MRLFITGGTGLVGQRLARAAIDAGHAVLVLSRSDKRAVLPASTTVLEGDPTQSGPWQESAASCDAIINLAGENIFAKRWSTDFKEALRRSRLETTHRIAEIFGRADCRAGVLVSASAVGYYGHSEGVTFREDAPPGEGFLAGLCVEWEAAARRAADRGARVVILRIGVVLDSAGGALAAMLPPFRRFVGGPIGAGQQYVSWIHVHDLVGLILHALETDSLAGPLNATAPHPVTNRELARTLGRVVSRPSVFRVPGFAMRLLLGEVSDVVLTGQRVLPAKAETSGYGFRFERLENALRDLLSKPG